MTPGAFLDACRFCWKNPTPGTAYSRCGRCKSRLYCSKECQVADWKSHKPHCTPVPAHTHCPGGHDHHSGNTFTWGASDAITWRTPADLAVARDESSIFYVKVIKPWAEPPFEIIGPMWPIGGGVGAVVEELCCVANETIYTADMVRCLLYCGNEAEEIMELRAPNIVRDRMLRIQILAERNPDVVACFKATPRTESFKVYTVLGEYYDPDDDRETIDAEVRGTYLRIDAYNQRIKDIVKEWNDENEHETEGLDAVYQQSGKYYPGMLMGIFGSREEQKVVRRVGPNLTEWVVRGNRNADGTIWNGKCQKHRH